MLPIQDARGRVIAFGGRILDKRDGVAKYLNSPDTDLFDKGRTLYNLHRAAPAARQSGRVVVVEGYMDVIGLHQAGIDNVVAPLGTALTEMQLELLWRMVEVPVLCFDGDAAGQRAATPAASHAATVSRKAGSRAVKYCAPMSSEPASLRLLDMRPPLPRLLSNNWTVCPLSVRAWAAESPAMPVPMIAIGTVIGASFTFLYRLRRG